jgi:adenine phosphoribosyltransferase
MNVKDYIADFPDFPKKGVLFRDITPLLENPDAFRETVELMAEKIRGLNFDYIVAIEARGFIFGTALAMLLKKPLVISRKPGKLPGKTISADYEKEYGKDTLEMHGHAHFSGKKFLFVDDVLATGNTAVAAEKLVEKAGGEMAGFLFLIELKALGGSKTLAGRKLFSLVTYE